MKWKPETVATHVIGPLCVNDLLLNACSMAYLAGSDIIQWDALPPEVLQVKHRQCSSVSGPMLHEYILLRKQPKPMPISSQIGPLQEVAHHMSHDDVLAARATCGGWRSSLSTRIFKLRVDLNKAVGQQRIMMPQTLLLALQRLTAVVSIHIVYRQRTEAELLANVVAALGQQVRRLCLEPLFSDSAAQLGTKFIAGVCG